MTSSIPPSLEAFLAEARTFSLARSKADVQRWEGFVRYLLDTTTTTSSSSCSSSCSPAATLCLQAIRHSCCASSSSSSSSSDLVVALIAAQTLRDLCWKHLPSSSSSSHLPQEIINTVTLLLTSSSSFTSSSSSTTTLHHRERSHPIVMHLAMSLAALIATAPLNTTSSDNKEVHRGVTIFDYACGVTSSIRHAIDQLEAARLPAWFILCTLGYLPDFYPRKLPRLAERPTASRAAGKVLAANVFLTATSLVIHYLDHVIKQQQEEQEQEGFSLYSKAIGCSQNWMKLATVVAQEGGAEGVKTAASCVQMWHESFTLSQWVPTFHLIAHRLTGGGGGGGGGGLPNEVVVHLHGQLGECVTSFCDMIEAVLAPPSKPSSSSSSYLSSLPTSCDEVFLLKLEIQWLEWFSQAISIVTNKLQHSLSSSSSSSTTTTSSSSSLASWSTSMSSSFMTSLADALASLLRASKAMLGPVSTAYLARATLAVMAALREQAVTLGQVLDFYVVKAGVEEEEEEQLLITTLCYDLLQIYMDIWTEMARLFSSKDSMALKHSISLNQLHVVGGAGGGGGGVGGGGGGVPPIGDQSSAIAAVQSELQGTVEIAVHFSKLNVRYLLLLHHHHYHHPSYATSPPPPPPASRVVKTYLDDLAEYRSSLRDYLRDLAVHVTSVSGYLVNLLLLTSLTYTTATHALLGSTTTSTATSEVHYVDLEAVLHAFSAVTKDYQVALLLLLHRPDCLATFYQLFDRLTDDVCLYCRPLSRLIILILSDLLGEKLGSWLVGGGGGGGGGAGGGGVAMLEADLPLLLQSADVIVATIAKWKKALLVSFLHGEEEVLHLLPTPPPPAHYHYHYRLYQLMTIAAALPYRVKQDHIGAVCALKVLPLLVRYACTLAGSYSQIGATQQLYQIVFGATLPSLSTLLEHILACGSIGAVGGGGGGGSPSILSYLIHFPAPPPPTTGATAAFPSPSLLPPPPPATLLGGGGGGGGYVDCSLLEGVTVFALPILFAVSTTPQRLPAQLCAMSWKSFSILFGSCSYLHTAHYLLPTLQQVAAGGGGAGGGGGGQRVAIWQVVLPVLLSASDKALQRASMVTVDSRLAAAISSPPPPATTTATTSPPPPPPAIVSACASHSGSLRSFYHRLVHPTITSSSSSSCSSSSSSSVGEVENHFISTLACYATHCPLDLLLSILLHFAHDSHTILVHHCRSVEWVAQEVLPCVLERGLATTTLYLEVVIALLSFFHSNPQAVHHWHRDELDLLLKIFTEVSGLLDGIVGCLVYRKVDLVDGGGGGGGGGGAGGGGGGVGQEVVTIFSSLLDQHCQCLHYLLYARQQQQQQQVVVVGMQQEEEEEGWAVFASATQLLQDLAKVWDSLHHLHHHLHDSILLALAVNFIGQVSQMGYEAVIAGAGGGGGGGSRRRREGAGGGGGGSRGRVYSGLDRGLERLSQREEEVAASQRPFATLSSYLHFLLLALKLTDLHVLASKLPVEALGKTILFALPDACSRYYHLGRQSTEVCALLLDLLWYQLGPIFNSDGSIFLLPNGPALWEMKPSTMTTLPPEGGAGGGAAGGGGGRCAEGPRGLPSLMACYLSQGHGYHMVHTVVHILCDDYHSDLRDTASRLWIKLCFALGWKFVQEAWQHVLTSRRAGGGGGGVTPRQQQEEEEVSRQVFVAVESGDWKKVRNYLKTFSKKH
eukprot:scaffold3243_cov173-Ochromonas_danica.AAC.5